MDIIECADYEAMSQAAAARVRDHVGRRPDALICLATGGSPERMYGILAADPLLRHGRVRGMALDEWHGVGRDHPCTCRHYLETHVFGPWPVASERRFVFDAGALDAEAECARMAAILRREGPIDLCILGLGRNGHLGLNEPSASLRPHAHVAELAAASQTHGMLAAEGVRATRGMTFGMADLLGAREILMVVSGRGKAQITRDFLEDRIRTDLPASFLHLHPHVTTIIDRTVFDREPASR